MLQTIADIHHCGDAYLNLSCPVCGSLPVPYFRRDGYFIDRCPECRFVYVRNVPSEEKLAALYRKYAGDHRASVLIPKRRLSKRLLTTAENWWHARNLVRYAAGRQRLLEIRCGEGHLLTALERTEQFNVEGIDYARGTIHSLRAKGLGL